MNRLSRTIGAIAIHSFLTLAPPFAGMEIGSYAGKNDYQNTKKYANFEFAMPNNKASMINFSYASKEDYQKQGEFTGFIFGITLSGLLNYKYFKYRRNKKN